MWCYFVNDVKRISSLIDPVSLNEPITSIYYTSKWTGIALNGIAELFIYKTMGYIVLLSRHRPILPQLSCFAFELHYSGVALMVRGLGYFYYFVKC